MFVSSSTSPRKVIFIAYLISALMCAVAIISSTELIAAEEIVDEPNQSKDLEFFENSIAPILQKRCYECHSHESGKAKGGLVLDSRRGWEKGGSEGAAIIPGDPDESLLMQAVRYEGFEMPPDEQLPADEIALLEQWIAMGAPDPRASKTPIIDPQKLWALKPISQPAVPKIRNVQWTRDDLDSFILSKLESKGLKPAGDADPYTLLRRVTLDLTGLPPTPDEIEAFIADNSDDAYEKVIDRLLESSAFGDHWARHWFDLSCYADLSDIQGNVLIRDAWRYRDYVIRALNTDKPLDRFIHEQIAGDLLPYASQEQRREQIIATGFLAIGPWTLQNYIKGQLDADVVDHQIDRIGRTFLGQTISCARCHDHKFDPVPTADYYAMAGIFHSTVTTSYDGPGVWSAITEVRLPDLTGSVEDRSEREKRLEEQRSLQQKLQTELTTLVLKLPGATNANVLTSETPIAANQKDVQYHVSFDAGPSVWAGASQSTTDSDGLQIDLIREDGSVLTGLRYAPGRWPGGKEAQQLTPAGFNYVGDGTGPVRFRLTSATPGNSRFGGALDNLVVTKVTNPPDTNANGEATSSNDVVIFEESFDDLVRGPIQGTQADTQLTVFAQATVPGWKGGGLNHSHAVAIEKENFAIQFFGGTTQELAKAQPVTPHEKSVHAQALELEKQLNRVTAQIAESEKQDAPEFALAVREAEKPADSPIYRGGDFQNLGEKVDRGFLSAVPTSTNYTIPTDVSGRLEMAKWLTDAENPLPSRVLVNRIWHHIFGRGIVRTVDYFGVHGETPSHPELLDFLAQRLRQDDDWSLKKTIRRMVMSRTYQMASTHHPQASELDPDNRLLWRMPRRRLTGESIRDAILAASGELDPGRGGPSLGLELKGNINGLGGNVNPPTWAGKIPDYIQNRRSVYLPLKRERPMGELEILSIFDFPHPNEITGARPNTTVATQALYLLNSPFVKQQAIKLSERLAREEPEHERKRVNRLYMLTTNRPAVADEIDTALAFLDQCSQELDGNRSAAWVQLSHAVLGSNAFVFRE